MTRVRQLHVSKRKKEPLAYLKRGLVILLYKLLRRAGAGGSEKGSRRAVPVR